MGFWMVLWGLWACPGADPPSPPDWREQYQAWRWPAPIPDFPLVDQHGEPFRLGELRQSWVLIGFVFTRCGDASACPLTMSKMAQVRDAWAARSPQDGARLHLLSVTLDPAWDTPARLRAYGERYGAERSSWTLATGDPQLVSDALPTLLGVLALPDPHAVINHTVKVALLKPGLDLQAEWTDNQFSVDEVLSQISKP